MQRTPGTFLNFAYGSNMASPRLRARTPSARPLGAARLAGHRLAWHKIGRDGSAKCDVVPTGAPHDAVWGVLFEIAEHERVHLDEAEGLGRGYEHRLVHVEMHVAVLAEAHADASVDVRAGRHAVPDAPGAAGLRLEAGVYQATHIDAALRPFDWYHALVLAGALEHGLPEAYVARLRAAPVVPDPDGERRALNLALLGRR